MTADAAEEKAVVKIDPVVARRAMMDNSARAASGAGASTSAGASTAQRGAAAAGGALASQLWVEKHKPRDSGELVGNQATIDWLRVFLRNWCAPLVPPQVLLWQLLAVQVLLSATNQRMYDPIDMYQEASQCRGAASLVVRL